VEQLGPLLPILLLVGAFYLLILRPAKARQNQANAVLRQLSVGARIMTTAGLFGTVTALEDDEIELEIAPGVCVRYVKAAVAKVVEPGPAVEEPAGTSGAAEASRVEGDTPEA
jgi:preprotein translocase subunit YajC